MKTTHAPTALTDRQRAILRNMAAMLEGQMRMTRDSRTMITRRNLDGVRFTELTLLSEMGYVERVPLFGDCFWLTEDGWNEVMS